MAAQEQPSPLADRIGEVVRTASPLLTIALPVAPLSAKERAWGVRVRRRLLRKRTGERAGLSVAVARQGSARFFYGHSSWHLSLVEIALGHFGRRHNSFAAKAAVVWVRH
jgi:hypothetical protein